MAHADLAAYENLVFVGKQVRLCPEVGVDIIDISDPTAPTKLANAPFYPQTAGEDMQALRIGSRDVLVVGLQACDETGKHGIDLIDITDPRHPQRLSLFTTEDGVHELNVTVTPDGQTLALLALPFLEPRDVSPDGTGGTGDLIIVDISDPTNPVAVSEWGVLDEPELGPDVFANVQRGSYPVALLHSVRANRAGTLLYLSYWDAGVIMLDISDPEDPKYVGRTTYSSAAEGNAHSVATTADEKLLVQADEDFSPTKLLLTSSAFEGAWNIRDVPYAQRITELDNETMTGEVVYIGRGCPDNAGQASSGEDVYVADPRGKLALIERGGCRFDQKIARAQDAGATGVILYGVAITQSERALSQGSATVELPDGKTVTLEIPAVVVTPDVGQALRAEQRATVAVKSEFQGWGYLRFFDISDPTLPMELSTYRTPHSVDPEPPEGGMYSVHNPEVVGNLVYASWYNDGVRVIDISDPTAPREVGFWDGADAPDDAPQPLIWSVVPHNGLLLASDMNYGLYILAYTP